MDRNSLILLTAATALLSSASAAQQTGARATTVRTRCALPHCAPSDSAARERQEALFLRIDSLRWQSDNARLSSADRERLSEEMERAVLALAELIDETSQTETAVVQRRSARAPVAASGSRVAIAIGSTCRAPGYLGVTFDGLNQEDCRGNEQIVRFFAYPRIALVAPSSPAERAGILQDDTLLSLGGTDVTRSEISLTKLLVPNARLAVRVRRDGEAKDLSVTVREAPSYYVMRATPFPSRAPTAPPSRVSVSVSPPPPVVAAPRMRWTGDGLAGAHVETVSEGLGRALGAKGGVVVISAEPGSPAYRSGLRDGDVIQTAAGRPVVTVRGLRGVLNMGDGAEGVKLTITRERRSREVTLRW